MPLPSPGSLTRRLSLGMHLTSAGLYLPVGGAEQMPTPGPGAYASDATATFKVPSPPRDGFVASSRGVRTSSSSGRLDSRTPGTSAAFKSGVPRTSLPPAKNGPGPAAYSVEKMPTHTAPLRGAWSRDTATRFAPDNVALDRLDSPSPLYYSPNLTSISKAKPSAYSAAPGSVLR